MTQPSRLKILILCDFEGRDANVIRDFLYSFNAFSPHSYYYFHDAKHLDNTLDFSPYDVIMFFWSSYWFWGMPVNDAAIEAIARSRALKVLMLQDEYRTVRYNNWLMKRLGIQVMLTCVAPKDHDVFYPRAEIPSLEAVHTVLTGYVPDYMVGLPLPAFEARPIDVGYRSRVMPYYLGDLTREKLIIAQKFERIACEKGFAADISVREEDRMYGKQWLDFLASCKFALGTESGASVIDFTGMIHYRCAQYLKAHPRATYDEVRERFFADVDGKVTIQTISPRIFESMAYGNVQVLHEGTYGDLLEADRHFISVKKDYSNVGEVVAKMRDTAFCKKLQENAYNEFIASGNYSYRAFVKRFDEIIAEHAPAPSADAGPSKVLFYLGNYIARGDAFVPKGNGFVRLPRPSLHHVMAAINTVREGLPRMLLVLGLLWDVPALARALAGILLRPSRWRLVGWRRLWADLVSLAAVRYVQGGGSSLKQPFWVESVWREDNLACYLISHWRRRGDTCRTAPDKAAELSVALASARCRRIAWDHAAVDYCVSVQLGGRGGTWLFLGATGSYWFSELMRLCQATGTAPASVVEGVVRDSRSALRSWIRLRPLLLAYQLSCAVYNYFIRAPLILPARIFRFKPGLRVLLLLGLLHDVPPLRGPVMRLLLRPWRWRDAKVKRVVGDLLRLSALRLARRGGWFRGAWFCVDAVWRPHAGACRLVSQETPEGSTCYSTPLPDAAREAIAAGKCRRLVWDHSAVSVGTGCGPTNYDAAWLLFGQRGIYTFRHLRRLCDIFGGDHAAIVQSVLLAGPCGLQSALLLRLAVKCQLWTVRLIYFPLLAAQITVCSVGRNPFTFPLRMLRRLHKLIGRLTARRSSMSPTQTESATSSTLRYRKSA